MLVRKAAVAGLFYPDDPEELATTVRTLLAEAARDAAAEPPGPPPKAVIVPHAGYVYSGPVAASVYARLLPLRGRIRRVVLLGPAHHAYVRGLAASRADAFDTPLGRIPVDRAAVERLLATFPQVVLSDEAHAREHSLEVQLPFLLATLGDFELVPLAVGDATPDEVAEVLDALWDGPETLIVVSSDLSHYYPYRVARQLDLATTRSIEALDPAGLHEESACGRIPVQGLLVEARRHGLRCRTVDLRNSGDTAGPRDRVVGYGGYLLAA